MLCLSHDVVGIEESFQYGRMACAGATVSETAPSPSVNSHHIPSTCGEQRSLRLSWKILYQMLPKMLRKPAPAAEEVEDTVAVTEDVALVAVESAITGVETEAAVSAEEKTVMEVSRAPFSASEAIPSVPGVSLLR